MFICFDTYDTNKLKTEVLQKFTKFLARTNVLLISDRKTWYMSSFFSKLVELRINNHTQSITNKTKTIENRRLLNLTAYFLSTSIENKLLYIGFEIIRLPGVQVIKIKSRTGSPSYCRPNGQVNNLCPQWGYIRPSYIANTRRYICFCIRVGSFIPELRHPIPNRI